MAAARISATANFGENKGDSGHKDKGSHKSPSVSQNWALFG